MITTGKSVPQFLRSDIAILAAGGVVCAMLHIATNGQYGFHRDELQAPDDAALGLPHAMSLTSSFWYRGYDSRLPDTVILAGFDLDEGNRLFEICAVAAKNSNPLGVENEESRDHPDILLCQRLRMPWPEYWEKFRRFG